MPIEKMSKLLKHADDNYYAVCAFNVFNYESIQWAIEVAEEEKSPIIIQFYPGYEKTIALSTIVEITKDAAARVSVPVALHLDHAISFEQALAGVKAGFPSIMIDGSTLPFEENVAITKQVTDAAHAMGIDVEAELGHVGSGMNLAHFTEEDRFTDPEKVSEFIERTGADALAISIGNAHGHYLSTPNLDFERLKSINNITVTSLVLHGGSDIPEDQIRKAIKMGINKINLATEYNKAFYDATVKILKEGKTNGYMYGLLEAIKDDIKAYVRSKINIITK